MDSAGGRVTAVEQKAIGAQEAIVRLFEELVRLEIIPADEATGVLEHIAETLTTKLRRNALEDLTLALGSDSVT